MGVIDAIRSEREKVKHTSFGMLHLCLPILGAAIFIIYYFLYGNMEDEKKLKMILELTATVFPLLISGIVSLNITLEERAAHFQTLLAEPSRCKIIIAKLMYIYGMGIFALFILFLLFILGLHLLEIADTLQVAILIKAVLGIACCNFIIYILHLFLSFKFGLGVSLFWGVFESLQCILYSNVELKGMARYIPFSWSINWIQDILQYQFSVHITEWIWIAMLTLGSVVLILLWFSHWDGRKNYE